MNTNGLLGVRGGPPGSQHRTTGMPNYTAHAAAALIKGEILAVMCALREGFVLGSYTTSYYTRWPGVFWSACVAKTT